MQRIAVALLFASAAARAAACSASMSGDDAAGDDATDAADGTSDGDDGDVASLPDDPQPPPNEGAGITDPPTTGLHDHKCGGVDWQRIHGWLLLPHQAPAIGDADEIERCVQRYAGWVTTEADTAMVSRASVYAALAATGECAFDSAWIGDGTPHEGIHAIATALAAGATKHDSDPPLMATYLATGAVACGGTDRWKLDAPAGYVDHYVAAYNAVKARSAAPPACAKRLVVSVALYTGMDEPGVDGVTAGNGCWTYERVSKTNGEWKLCNYDGTVHNAAGVKWAYDDTNAAHVATTERNRITACKSGIDGRGYIYMANRGDGWPSVVSDGVTAHFAEIYSSQSTVDDQFTAWKSAGTPGQPMLNFGEAATTAAKIKSATKRACAETSATGYFGVYVYPEPLRGARMSALVQALNECTAAP